jgi:RimJ/RimL family protein N-acetyltransferase
MILEGKLIRFRPFKDNDYLVTYNWRCNKNIRFLSMIHPYIVTLELEKEWLHTILNDNSNKTLYFAIETINENRLIGYFRLKDINLINKLAWLSIVIGASDSRGKGFGQESMELGLRYASDYLNLRKLSLEVLNINIPAIKLYEKLGFEHEGTMKNHFYFEGKYYNVEIMSKFIA